MFSLIIRPILVIFSLALAHLLHAQVVNEGVIGAPFYGVTTDSSLSLTNQVGPYADFAVPTKLNANSESISLLSGEFSKLEASLSLDDGTISTLSPKKVLWTSTSEELVLKDGFVTAKNISKTTRVSISASAEGLSAIVFIRLEAGTTFSDPTVSPSISVDVLSDSLEMTQPGWKKSSWFGNYFQGANNWIHHQFHGWLYADGNDPSSIWLWSPRQKWLWTGPGIYPHMFRNQDGTWIYFIVQAIPEKVYYNQTTKSLERTE